MTCAGVCTLCGHSRDSKLCECLSRRRNEDPIHETFADAEAFIRDTRFFGLDARHEALVLITAGRQSFYSKFAGGRIADGHLCKRIDRDAKRLVDKANGKLYSMTQKLAERPKTDKASATGDGLTNSQRLHRLLNPSAQQ